MNRTTLALFLLPMLGCTERDEVWDAPIAPVAVGLSDAVAVIDAPAERVLLMQPAAEQALALSSLPIAEGFADAAPTPDGERLLVLSRGVVPRRKADDAEPELAVITAGASPRVESRYRLGDPLSRLAVDPASRFAVAFPSQADGALLLNPNELVVFDLDRPPAADNPVPITLRSFGGRPERLTFTPLLDLPGGARRLLVVETDRDVALVDLSSPTTPEITIPLTTGPKPLEPTAVAVSDGAPDRTDDARLAIRMLDQSNVILVDLLPASDASAPQSFRAAPNVVFVGGVPSDLAFVNTDGGLRLAAMVPAERALTLVDPATGTATAIDLAVPFERISLVTEIVGPGADGSDVALLWSTSSPDIALVALGSTVGKPYKSVERLGLADPIDEVRDVPSPNAHLKIMLARGGSLVVLDLRERTAAPIASSSYATRVLVPPTGRRAWVDGAGPELARLDLGSLHPLNLVLRRNVSALFETARQGGGRALVVLHTSGALGATVLDADRPDVATAREHAALLLGGLP
jgi:hypothetical protein